MGDLLAESQDERDAELSEYSGRPVSDLRNLRVGAPESLMYHAGGDVEEATFDHLYRAFRHMDAVHHLRTLAAYTVTRRGGHIRRLAGLLGPPTGHRVLDFGCGVGTHGLWLAGLGAVVDLLDVDGPLRQYAIWRAGRRGLVVRFLDVDADLGLGTYDAILCLDVLEHVADPVGALGRLTAAMRAGGLIVLEVSRMVKPTSGHFSCNIRRWVAGGPRLLADRFRHLGGCLYERR